jgi:hypothetical protein
MPFCLFVCLFVNLFGSLDSTVWSKCFAKQGVPIHIRPVRDEDDDVVALMPS